jgi:hypothetical protein
MPCADPHHRIARDAACWVGLGAFALLAVGCQTGPALVARSQAPEAVKAPRPLSSPADPLADPFPPIALPTPPKPLDDELVPALPPVFEPRAQAPDDDPPQPEEEPKPPGALPPLPVPNAEPTPEPSTGPVTVGSRVIPTGELTQLTGLPAGGCASCGGKGGGCDRCEPYPATGFASRLVGLVYETLCCPDPCYQPKWMPLVDAAFFTDGPRPVSHTRLRWEYGYFSRFPDRAEYFWARADGNGKGPRPVAGAAGIPRVDYHELSQYTETAAGPGFSAFAVTPYRSVNPQFSTTSGGAGFADISLGTKSVLFDSELFLLALQFKTTLPVGRPSKGLGTGHVSLEPSLLFGLRTSPDSYLQGQIAEWIPIAGDPQYSGALLHYHFAFNHVLWRPIQAVQLVGTLEAHGWMFQDGGWTDPQTGFRPASGRHVVQAGPGFRLFFCDKYDFGVGSNFGLTGLNQVNSTFRFEFRVRY